MIALLRRAVFVAWPPLVLLCAVVVCWEAAVAITKTPAYLLPPPSRVAVSAWQHADELFQATLFSGLAAIAGFACSLLIGTGVALAFSQSAILRRCGYPYAIFLQTVPIIAIAPLIIRWFGNGFQSVVVTAFIISLFPIITNVTAGLLNVDAGLLDLFRLNNAGRAQVLFKLRWPNAVPGLVTGARTSSGLSVVGAIVGEFFAGYGTERYGLGFLIQFSTEQLRTDELFSAVLASTLLGVLIFATVNQVGRMILRRWGIDSEFGVA